MKAELSVIVPCYNVEKYIGRCLDSLMNQTLKEICIIVIDDGSTDKTAEIIQDYQSRYPDRVNYYFKTNDGIAAARNFGLSKVKTPYFGFLDSDDYVKPEFFEKMLNKIKETGSEIVVCGFEWVHENMNKKDYVTIEGPYHPGKEMLLGLFATLWNKVYKTEFVRNLGLSFPDGYRYEDASFLYRMVPSVNKVEFITEPFISYVQRPGSITHTHNEKVKDMVHVFQGILDYYKESGYYKIYKDELEYIFIRFFLGNSFLRTVQIKDKKDRDLTMNLSWRMLNDNFPNWKKNQYLNQGGLKNMYYKLVNEHNYVLFGKIFSLIKR